MTRKLRKLLAKAERLGATDAVERLVSDYLDGADKAADEYEAFHWGEPVEGARLIEVPSPPAVAWQLGELVEVVYEATKGGELAHWVHAFGGTRPALAFARPSGRKSGQLYMLGGSYRVTSRGIVG